MRTRTSTRTSVWTYLVLGLAKSRWEWQELFLRSLWLFWSVVTDGYDSVTAWTSTFPLPWSQNTQSSTTSRTVVQTWSSTDLNQTTTSCFKAKTTLQRFAPPPPFILCLTHSASFLLSLITHCSPRGSSCRDVPDGAIPPDVNYAEA